MVSSVEADAGGIRAVTVTRRDAADNCRPAGAPRRYRAEGRALDGRGWHMREHPTRACARPAARRGSHRDGRAGGRLLRHLGVPRHTQGVQARAVIVTRPGGPECSPGGGARRARATAGRASRTLPRLRPSTRPTSFFSEHGDSAQGSRRRGFRAWTQPASSRRRSGLGAAGTIGERVMAAVTPRRVEGGAQSELLLVPAASVAAVPDRASLAEAATLPMNGLTALLALELLALRPGQSLAVTGGAGLLASYAIAIAAERGLRVITDAKPAGRAARAQLRRDRRSAPRRSLPVGGTSDRAGGRRRAARHRGRGPGGIPGHR